MKKVSLGLLLISVLVLILACATANVTKMKGKQHNIDVQAGVTGKKEAMTEKFTEAAKKQCNGKYNIISKKFVVDPDGSNHLKGVVECK